MRALGPITVLIAGCGMLAWTWGAWPDPLVDFGREAYVPWRLAEGDTLFTDIAWFNGPLSPYANSLLFRLFGPGLHVLFWSNVVVLAATVAMVYGLAERLADRFTATVAGLVFVLVFAFGQYVGIGNYNWIAPYSHEVTHGVALALASVVCLERWRRTASMLALAGAGLALGLCFLTKAETFLAGLLGSAVLLAGSARRGDRRLAVFLAAALLPPLISWSTVGGLGTLGAWPWVVGAGVARLDFYRTLMGIDRPAFRVLEVVTWTGFWLALLTSLVAIAWVTRRTSGRVAPLLTVAAVLSVLALTVDTASWPNSLRPLPLFVIGIVAWLFIEGRHGAQPRWAGIAFGAFCFALLTRTILHVRVGHYGFALTAPACMLLVIALVGWLPQRLSRLGLRGDVVRAGVSAALAVFVVQHMAITEGWLSGKTEIVGSGADAFRADARGAFVSEAVSQLVAARASTMAALPEGVMINYLARIPNPTPYVNFMPVEEMVFGAEAWTEAFQRSPPDRILVVPKDVSEYGRGQFGEGYAQSLAAWIGSEYAARSAIRAEGVQFEILVLEPRRAQPSPDADASRARP